MEKLIGKRGDYIVRRPIGSGGMWEVYEVWQIYDKTTLVDGKRILEEGKNGDRKYDLDETYCVVDEWKPEKEKPCENNMTVKCAVKKLKKLEDADSKKKIRDLFEQEIKILEAAGEVEGVPRLIDRGDDFYAMELIDGVPLKKESLTGKQVIDIGIRLCDILEKLHCLPTPVVHLDIKPSNLMLSSDGKLWLIDFGLARFLEGYGTSDVSSTQALLGIASPSGAFTGNNTTEMGDFKKIILAGTKGYAAPEQYGVVFVTDKRTDIFQVGKTLQKLANKDETNPFLYREIMEVAEKCTFAKRQQRYPNIRGVKNDLMICEKKAEKNRRLFHVKFVSAALLFFLTLILIFAGVMRAISPTCFLATLIPGHFLWNDEGLVRDVLLTIDHIARRVKRGLPFLSRVTFGKNTSGDGLFLDIVMTYDSLNL